MSRTDAHVPLQVRIARGDIGHAEVHDHRDGVCDLPSPLERDALLSRPGHCHWEWRWDGHGICSCELCHGGDALRRERHRERQATKRELRALVRRWNPVE